MSLWRHGWSRIIKRSWPDTRVKCIMGCPVNLWCIVNSRTCRLPVTAPRTPRIPTPASHHTFTVANSRIMQSGKETRNVGGLYSKYWTTFYYVRSCPFNKHMCYLINSAVVHSWRAWHKHVHCLSTKPSLSLHWLISIRAFSSKVIK